MADEDSDRTGGAPDESRDVPPVPPSAAGSGPESGPGFEPGQEDWSEPLADSRLFRASRIMVIAGATGMAADTLGWILISLKKVPEYPYFPIAIGCAVVYFGGRLIQLVLRRR